MVQMLTQSKFYNSGQPKAFERATCPRCHGEGRYNYQTCYKCAGYGVVFILTKSDNPLDCICTYHTHRPAGQGTRTDAHRNPNCPVHQKEGTK